MRVTDDDPSMLEALVGLVRSLGYDGAALYQPRISWHRLTLDNSLVPSPTSGMNGFELKRELSMRHSSLPVIMITARAEPDIEEKAMSSGATCFLRKPFEAQTLVSCLQRVLSI